MQNIFGLTNKYWLFYANSQITFSGNAFGLLHNLEELDLSNCEISRVDQNSFKILDKLKTLNLNGNG